MNSEANELTCPHCGAGLKENEHGDYPCEDCGVPWGVDLSGDNPTYYDELGVEWGPALL